ncbi:MAG: DUF4292 domain-containing protein, partial [Pedobacter sp.]
MKRNILNSLLLASIVVLGFGCKPKKVIVTAPQANAEKLDESASKKAENLTLLKSKDLPFNTLSLRGKAKLNVSGDENNVTMLIRMEKDKKIWVSVTAIAGIEVARAVITPDSLLLRNNLQKTYIKKPFSYVYGFTNKQVDFAMLQSVLSGNTIKNFMKPEADLSQENSVWTVSGKSENVAYRILFNTLLKVNETSLNDAQAGQAFKVVYGKYTPVNNALFPSALEINTMAGAKKINIGIEFTKIESNVALEFPFSVP